ncbi:hypothetical protein O6P43_002086 [Quillaja saponaria]|uniref:Uncharacterized protein n=1 Tax=Quillaja saponaria TaxID=32244 RepID=A0AAD7VK84_QUISA|nr:hypothetical protein O6P43_002086 [Quillaja saponaria]
MMAPMRDVAMPFDSTSPICTRLLPPHVHYAGPSSSLHAYVGPSFSSHAYNGPSSSHIPSVSHAYAGPSSSHVPNYTTDDVYRPSITHLGSPSHDINASPIPNMFQYGTTPESYRAPIPHTYDIGMGSMTQLHTDYTGWHVDAEDLAGYNDECGSGPGSDETDDLGHVTQQNMSRDIAP